MKLFGILATVSLVKADFMSVFEAHKSVSLMAESFFTELADAVNGKLIICLLWTWHLSNS